MRARHQLVVACLLAWGRPFGQAQQFASYYRSVEYPGISDSCAKALNRTILCAPLLATIAEGVPRLSSDSLTSLCVDSCPASIKTVKATIQQSCNLTTDVITYRNQVLPAYFIADQFMYAYNLRCRKDSLTKQFCDTQFTSWLGQSRLTTNQTCSDCLLGNVQTQLNSTFGYSDALASQFQQLTSSCGSTNYAYTSPTPYTISTATIPADSTATATSSSIAASGTSASSSYGPGCYSTYTIQANDTCNSIAVAQKVSTYAVYGPNGIGDCTNLSVGQQICLLGSCTLYQVRVNDTCDGIIAASRLSGPDAFLAWNPDVNFVCNNLYQLVNNYVCLSRPEGLVAFSGSDTQSNATVSSRPPYTATTTPLLPTASGTTPNCLNLTNWNNISSVQDTFYQSVWRITSQWSNTCLGLASKWGVSGSDLLRWNPSLNSTNCTMSPGFSYCAVGNDAVPLPLPDTAGCIAVANSTIGPGTAASCNCFTAIAGADSGATDCPFLADAFNITTDLLQQWNPWVGSNCSTGLYARINVSQIQAVCVNVSGPVLARRSDGEAGLLNVAQALAESATVTGGQKEEVGHSPKHKRHVDGHRGHSHRYHGHQG